ncbi:MAG: DUF433 domain-containing protein [Planctomycetes bacterium]|nr:DUF433 domain-containing protein [Planctomycetota bacterium]
MNDRDLLSRITTNPEIMVGKPVICGTRLTVEYILGRLGHGSSIEDLLEEYPRLAVEDIRACQLFAARAMSDVSFMPISPESE